MSYATDSRPSPSLRHEWVAAGVLLLVAAGYFAALETVQPYYFLWDDNSSYFLPFYVHNYESLVGFGELPHVNYHQYLGHSYLASGQPAVLYPPLYAGLALARLFTGDLRAVVDVLVVLHLLASALGMFVLLRRLRISPLVAVGTALLWMSFPFVVQVARNWLWVAYVAAYLPWNLWLLDRLCERPGASRILALAAVKALLVYQGYVQYAVLLVLFEGLLLLLRWVFDRREEASWWRQALSYAAAQAASVALAAPLLVPMFHAKAVSAYRTGALSFSEFISLSLPWKAFFAAQVFQMEPRVIHEASGVLFYVGLPSLAALAALALRHDRRRFLIAAAVALVALVLSTRAYGMMYHLPLLSSFRWPFKSFLFCLLFLTVALAGAFDALWRHRRPVVRLLGAGLLLAGLVTHAVFALSPAWSGVFGPNRVDRSVAEMRREAAERLPLSAGRIVSLWMNPSQPRIHRLLIFNYATLVRGFHLGGYEPMISKEHLELAVNLEYSNIFRYELTEEALAYLSSWSVRFLVAPDEERFGPTFARFPQLRRISQDDGIVVYENTLAEPFAYLIQPGGPVVPVEVEWRPSSVRLRTAGRGGLLRLAVAPLPWYVYSLDGEDAGAVAYDDERHVVLEVPPGVEVVEVRYVDVPFLVGVGVAAAFLLAVGATWARRGFTEATIYAKNVRTGHRPVESTSGFQR